MDQSQSSSKRPWSSYSEKQVKLKKPHDETSIMFDKDFRWVSHPQGAEALRVVKPVYTCVYLQTGVDVVIRRKSKIPQQKEQYSADIMSYGCSPWSV